MINPLSVQQYSKTDSVLRNLIYALNLTSTFQDLPLLVTNNKDEDQTARTRCLITVFVIRCLEGMTVLLRLAALAMNPGLLKSDTCNEH